MLTRSKSLRIRDGELPLPVFFPAVSSLKTALSPLDYVRLLVSLAGLNKQFLVSAFDVASTEPDAFTQLLEQAAKTGATVLMDSGNYESYWMHAQPKWSQSVFHEVLGSNPCSLAFCFDEETPALGADAQGQLITERWRQDQLAAGSRLVVPIIHAEQLSLPTLCTLVAETTGMPIIAVPERRLGDGVIERARAVRSIRSALDGLGRYVALHLLGTGNPISIAIYTASGADSFDGLEWCQTVVDYETAFLFHISQADFFRAQTSWGDGSASFHAWTLAHNLAFYSDWMTRLRNAVLADDVIRFCRLNFPARIFRSCAAELKWGEVA